MDQKSYLYEKVVTHTDEPLENYHLTLLASTELFIIFQFIVLLL